MGFQDTIDAVAVALQIGHKVVVAGPPGGAKSAVCRAVARAVKGEFCFLGSGGQILPESIAIPVTPDKQGDGIVLEARKVILRAKAAVDEGRLAVIMADEISRCTTSGRNALLSPMQEGQFGDLVVDVRRTAWMLAYNPVDTDAGTLDMEAAFSNRVTHLSWEMPFEWWQEAALAGFPDPRIPTVPADWETHKGKFWALVTGFLNANRGMANAEPAEEAARCGPWPSYRSWTNVVELRAACHAAGCPRTVEALLIAGTVGTTAANALRQYEARLDLPDPEALLTNPQSALPKNADQLYVTVQSVASAVANNATSPRWLAGLEVLSRVSEAGDAGIAIGALRVLSKCRPAGTALPVNLTATFVSMLKQAGLQITR